MYHIYTKGLLWHQYDSGHTSRLIPSRNIGNLRRLGRIGIEKNETCSKTALLVLKLRRKLLNKYQSIYQCVWLLYYLDIVHSVFSSLFFLLNFCALRQLLL